MSATSPFAALVLAAGLSSRMRGANKLLLAVGQEPLIRHTVRQVLGARPRDLVVLTGYQDAAVRAALADLPVRLHVHPRFEDGQMSSVAAGMAALSGSDDPVMVCLGDMAALRPGDYRELAQAYAHIGDKSVLVPMHQGRRGNPVMFAPACVREIAQRRGQLNCRRWIEQHPERVRVHETASDRCLIDVDTPADYTRLLDRLNLHAAPAADQLL